MKHTMTQARPRSSGLIAAVLLLSTLVLAACGAAPSRDTTDPEPTPPEIAETPDTLVDMEDLLPDLKSKYLELVDIIVSHHIKSLFHNDSEDGNEEDDAEEYADEEYADEKYVDEDTSLTLNLDSLITIHHMDELRNQLEMLSSSSDPVISSFLLDPSKDWSVENLIDTINESVKGVDKFYLSRYDDHM